MLRVKEVATRLKVHPATVYRWIKEGHLEAVRYGKPQVVGAATGGPGGAIRVPESALAVFSPPTEAEVA
ncbi:helix-turn-helix domain-containing protein [Streptomyces sp. NBC_01794]|uniref:helix-turn-helix domain-containing protein n=1 Tax=Streptomyces sp. NBC_01794 TaxID=2975942 RepID=UPI003090B6F3|nr:helix-turn-helix domain-containing protein [Streptomyces sp. NBC_01794]